MNKKLDVLNEPTGFLGKYSKYRTLAILVAAFLILTTALALLTVYSAERFARATDELEIITRQGLVSYRINENLMDVHLAIEHNAQSTGMISDTIAISTLPKQTQEELKQLENLIQTFDSSVSALQDGGDVVFADTTINTDGLTSSELRPMVEKIASSWQTHRKPFQAFIKQTDTGQINTKTLDQVVEYTHLHSGEINSDIASMRQALNTLIQDQTILVKRVQFIGILLAFGVFLAIVFGALRRLRQTDEELLIAQRQTDDIMQTINEGLFLVDKDLIIADKYSGKLEEIMQQKNLAGRSLYDVLRGMISQKDMDTLKLFIEQLYNPWVVEELIKDLNPLQQVLVSYVDDKQLSHTKFLKFNFLRVLDDEETIKNVFVSATDITTEVRLQNQLDKDKEQHDRQIATISYLLTVDDVQLARFIRQTKDRIDRMNNILKVHNTDNLSAKVNQLYRDIHSLKGDASAMKLANIVDIAEKQENLLKTLNDKSDLKGNDFLPFTVGLDELMSAIGFIEDLTRRLNLDGNTAIKSTMQNNSFVAFDDNTAHQNAPHDNKWTSFFANYANDIAQRQGKQVEVDVQGFELLDSHPKISAACKDIAMQLLKNAIVHGIEAPEQRLANHKAQNGHISLSLLPADDNYKLHIRDDGQGINWTKIRQKAVEQGIVSAENAHNLTQRDLLKFMFSSGFSTADHQDEDAGRGIGMDIIHQLAQNLNGKISLNSQPNQFTDISITFPSTHI